MYARGLKQFYIDEISKLFDGRLVMPRTWIKRNGELHADCDLISTSAVSIIINSPHVLKFGSLILIQPNAWKIESSAPRVSIAARLFYLTYQEVLLSCGGLIPWASKYSQGTALILDC